MSRKSSTRNGETFFIYALVCPLTLEVKYVGQTLSLTQRTRAMIHSHSHSEENSNPLTQWLRTLGYLRPYYVILEQGINRQVEVTTAQRRDGTGRRVPKDTLTTWLSSCLEAKWIKRFRRTIVNRNKTGVMAAYQSLVNPPLPWGNDSDAPSDIPIRKRATALEKIK